MLINLFFVENFGARHFGPAGSGHFTKVQIFNFIHQIQTNLPVDEDLQPGL